MQKHVNLVDLVNSFPTNIFLQILASIQQRTSLIKFDHLAEKIRVRFDIEPFNSGTLRGYMRNVRVGRGSKVTFLSRVNDREYPYKPGAFLASAALFGEVDIKDTNEYE